MSQNNPLFLERRGYRLRRVRDAARLLPILGLFAVFLPLLAGGGSTRAGVLYVFGAWLMLIILAALLGRLLHRMEQDDDTQETDGA